MDILAGKKAWGKIWWQIQWKIHLTFCDNNHDGQMRRIKIAPWLSVDSKRSRLLHQLWVFVFVLDFQLRLTSVPLNLASTYCCRHLFFFNWEVAVIITGWCCLPVKYYMIQTLNGTKTYKVASLWMPLKIMLDVTLNLKGYLQIPNYCYHDT